MMNSQNYTPSSPPPSTDLSCAASYLVYDWFHDQFPAWESELYPKQVTHSLSLIDASIPESAHGPKGMVHFKSILDPLWSTGDMASLRGGFSWILLVLSPFERFYELDPALDELSTGTTQLVIWRPDRPTVEESACLRVNSLVRPTMPVGTGQKNLGGSASGKGVRELLSALYIQRGSLIVQGVRHAIHQEMGDMGLTQYIAACLTCLASSVAARIAPAHQEGAENLAARWISLLSGQEDQSVCGMYTGESQILAWAGTYLDAGATMLTGRLQSMPDPFLTTQFRDETKFFDAALERMNHIMQCLRRGEIGLVPAMAQVAQTFNGDEARLLRWKGLAEDLPKFLSWLPKFESSFDYISGAFPVSEVTLENAKKSLLTACAEPQRFLDAREREDFDRTFDKFKQGYIDFYQATHEETVHIVANQEKMKARVDSVALRNLELLSDLSLADRRYLNRARAIGKFVQSNQCDLPVREILSRQPRCYCNFNPAGNRLLVNSVDRMNETIKEGIDQCRAILRRCRMVIIQELKNLSPDDHHAKQIASLLSRGPMIPLKQDSIELLNRIMKKHPEAFDGAGMRTQTSDLRPQTSDHRTQTSDHRPQTSDLRMNRG
jgi:hypothetical protein